MKQKDHLTNKSVEAFKRGQIFCFIFTIVVAFFFTGTILDWSDIFTNSTGNHLMMRLFGLKIDGQAVRIASIMLGGSFALSVFSVILYQALIGGRRRA
jgi:hypothetical protein